jgi:uncharacterized protein YggE
MLRSFAVAAAASAYALIPAAHAAEIEIESDGPVIELSITESVAVDPDVATIYAGVTKSAPTAVEAMRENAVEMRKVIERIKALGIAEKDIQTAGISVSARYEWDEATRKSVFRGYDATNLVTVKLRDIEATGRILDALVVAGATDINGPSFSIENDEAIKDKAREQAVKRGQARAEAYARMLGYSEVRVLEISEAVTGFSGFAAADRLGISAEAAAESTAPVQPGRVNTGVTVTIKYEVVTGDKEEEG